MGNSEVRLKLLGLRIQCLERTLSQNKLMLLEHVLRVSTESPPRCSLFLRGR